MMNDEMIEIVAEIVASIFNGVDSPLDAEIVACTVWRQICAGNDRVVGQAIDDARNNVIVHNVHMFKPSLN